MCTQTQLTRKQLMPKLFMRTLYVSVVLGAVVMGLPGCNRVLEVPEPPGPVKPGTISGRAVYVLPGSSQRIAAKGAAVSLLSSSVGSVVDSNGNFLLDGIKDEQGSLLFRLDIDGDGRFERQRLVTLESLKAGPGRDVNIGEVVLTENGQIRGRITRGDSTSTTGNAGTLVFVPEGPFTTLTGDDGSFLLTDLPQGALRIAFFRAGFEARGFEDLVLEAGQDLVLKDIILEPIMGAVTTTGGIKGTVTLVDGSSAAGISVLLFGSAQKTVTTDADGNFTFDGLSPGLYHVFIEKDGYRTARLVNLLVGDTVIELGGVVVVSGMELPNQTGDLFDGGIPTMATDDGGTVIPPSRTRPTVSVAVGQQVSTNAKVTLEALNARDFQGGKNLIYHWAQANLDGGVGITLTPNHSITASKTTFTSPAAPTTLTFVLDVADVYGQRSDPVFTQVEVVDRPVARLTPTVPASNTELHVSQKTRILLDGSGSTTPLPEPLTYNWSLTGTGGTLENLVDGGAPGPTDSKVYFHAGNSGTAEASLSVADSFSTSDTVKLPMLVVPVPSGFSVVVNGGRGLRAPEHSTVVMAATVVSTDPTETFTYTWRHTGIEASPVLSGENTPICTWIAPGLDSLQFGDRFDFALDVLGSNGVTRSVPVSVQIYDGTAPHIYNSDPPLLSNAIGPWRAAYFLFNETLDPASVNKNNFTLSIEADGGFTPLDSSMFELSYEASQSRVVMEFTRPLDTAHLYRIHVGAVQDAVKNVAMGIDYDFTPRSPEFEYVEYSEGPSNEPRPVPLILNDSSRYFSDKDYFAILHESFNNCGPTLEEVHLFQVYEDYYVGLGLNQVGYQCISPADWPQRRYASTRTESYFMTAPVDGGVLYVADPSGVLEQSAFAPATIFSDNDVVAGVFDTGGLRWVTLDTSSKPPSWTPSTGELIDQSFTYASTGDAITGAISGTRRLAVGVESAGRKLRVFEAVGAGAWAALPETTPTGGVYMPRATYVNGQPMVCFTHDVATIRTLSCLLRKNNAWVSVNNVAGGVPGAIFDVQGRGQTLWLTYSVAGMVRVKYLVPSDAAPAFSDLYGASGDPEWNYDDQCVAAAPQIRVLAQRLVVVWQERCGSGGWSFYAFGAGEEAPSRGSPSARVRE